MSLYTALAEKLAAGRIHSQLGSAANQATERASGALAGALGSGKLGKAVAQRANNALRYRAADALNQYLPLHRQQLIDSSAHALADLADRDWQGAGERLLDHFRPDLSGNKQQTRFWNTPASGFAGLSPKQALRLYQQQRSLIPVKKNLWLLEITSALAGGTANLPDRFNLLALELDYSPFVIVGDKKRPGAAVVDSVQGQEAVELRLTCLDDETGNLKHWFAAHHGAIVACDGTVGVPADYAVRIKIVYGAITRASASNAYYDLGLFRPVSLESSLSRREDTPAELQMTFTQLDTFMRVR